MSGEIDTRRNGVFDFLWKKALRPSTRSKNAEDRGIFFI